MIHEHYFSKIETQVTYPTDDDIKSEEHLWSEQKIMLVISTVELSIWQLTNSQLRSGSSPILQNSKISLENKKWIRSFEKFHSYNLSKTCTTVLNRILSVHQRGISLFSTSKLSNYNPNFAQKTKIFNNDNEQIK